MIEDARMFRVHWGQISRAEKDAWTHLGCPRSVPWEFIAPHERQAINNHSQTLQRLDERGGLSPAEMMCVIEGRGLRGIEKDVVAIPRLVAALAKWRIDR